jgi:hypothetical protein
LQLACRRVAANLANAAIQSDFTVSNSNCTFAAKLSEPSKRDQSRLLSARAEAKKELSSLLLAFCWVAINFERKRREKPKHCSFCCLFS